MASLPLNSRDSKTIWRRTIFASLLDQVGWHSDDEVMFQGLSGDTRTVLAHRISNPFGLLILDWSNDNTKLDVFGAAEDIWHLQLYWSCAGYYPCRWEPQGTSTGGYKAAEKCEAKKEENWNMARVSELLQDGQSEIRYMKIWTCKFRWVTFGHSTQ